VKLVQIPICSIEEEKKKRKDYKGEHSNSF
jgi:hypothetical protein